MAGNRDDGAERWSRKQFELLAAQTDRVMEILPQVELDPADVAGLDRFARLVTNVARASKAVVALASPPARSRNPVEDAEEGDANGDIEDPAEEALLRAELQSRMDHHRAALERKRLARGVVDGGDARCDRRDAPAARSSDCRGDGLVDVGAAGRAGVGQDLCGGLVAERAGADRRTGSGAGGTGAARCARGDDRGAVGPEGDGRDRIQADLGSQPEAAALAQ